ncbi:MAG: hypothetical protein FWG65_10230 [Turicibacter sp.]|nr:hypothetical protein [Turicibacter sp.]
MKILELYEILQGVGVPVFHYMAVESKPTFIVYSEYASRFERASGEIWREIVKVAVTHVSETEFDPTLDDLKRVLLENKIGFEVQTKFDTENKLIVSYFEFEIYSQWKS